MTSATHAPTRARRSRPAPPVAPAPSDALARAAAILDATRAANARRLGEAQAHAAAIIAEAEMINASFIKLAEDQVADLLEQASAAVVPTPKPVAMNEPAAPVTAAAVDGGIELIAGPFGRFSQLATFTQQLRGLPGVNSLDTRQFLKGTVHLRLRYDDPIPLAVRLAELSEGAPTVVSATAGRIELRVSYPDAD